jgi:hypothetical protein
MDVILGALERGMIFMQRITGGKEGNELKGTTVRVVISRRSTTASIHSANLLAELVV